MPDESATLDPIALCGIAPWAAAAAAASFLVWQHRLAVFTSSGSAFGMWVPKQVVPWWNFLQGTNQPKVAPAPCISGLYFIQLYCVWGESVPMEKIFK